mmetsp:Transcript_71369/g.83031  ORF Transcript_71369/g.83031 Transcript_71369/m.83031 type:complete len:575 (-) Transcript_71369:195-1919(-)
MSQWRTAARQMGRCVSLSVLGAVVTSVWRPFHHNDRHSTSSECAVHCDSGNKPQVVAGQCIEGLPEYTEQDVAAHRTIKASTSDVWVRYKCGVYDVSEFIRQHPGGVKRIMLAAGDSIERFWRQFTIHQEDSVRSILERHRIGNVKGYTGAQSSDEEEEAERKRWENEPQRSPALAPLSARPFNAETPEAALDDFITPNDLFFVRNHMPVPLINTTEVEGRHGKFCLQVEGEGLIPRCFRLQELRDTFPAATVTTTIQCGGNRRSEMTAAHVDNGATVKGLSWSNGGIGTATYRGVWLRDVIHACQVGPAAVNDPYANVKHILMEGADKDDAGHFNVSVPYDLAMDPKQDCLIAFEMNGQPIPRDHGYPLRAIIPGTVGVRNCKWLQRISLQHSESSSVWQQQDYKNFPPYATAPDPSLPSVYAMPVQGSVTDASTNGETVSVSGYAYAGGGTGIQRVDVSFDGGKTFETSAPLADVPPEVKPKLSPATRRDAWAWRQFHLKYPIDDIKVNPSVVAATRDDATSSMGGTDDVKQFYQVCVRAVTDDNATQPPIAAYNFRGLLYNGYSCRDVVLP